MTEADRKFLNGILKLQEVILLGRGWVKMLINGKVIWHYGN